MEKNRTKTQTRRVIKPQPIADAGYDGGWRIDTRGQSTSVESFNRCSIYQNICPYGQVGDRLWVRRTKEGKFIWKKSLAEIWLEITGIRVERLQEITFDGILAEGINLTIPSHHFHSARDELDYALAQFRILWDSLNAKRGYSWESNSFVWVIEFKLGR